MAIITVKDENGETSWEVDQPLANMVFSMVEGMRNYDYRVRKIQYV
jgi:hypothetical protein